MNQGIYGYPRKKRRSTSLIARVALASVSGTNAKQAWTLVGTAAQTFDGLFFAWTETTCDQLVDISYGPQGGAVMLGENMLATALTATGLAVGSHPGFFLPGVPAGERIWMRHQASATSFSSVAGVLMGLVGSPYAGVGYSLLEAYGTVTATSGCTSVDPGASINTKGAWHLLGTASRDLVAVQYALGQQNNSARTTNSWFLDIGYRSGTGGGEQIIVPDIALATHVTGDYVAPQGGGPWPVDVPAGSQIVARMESGINDANDRLVGIAAYGLGTRR